MNFVMWLQHNVILLVIVVLTLILLSTYWPSRGSLVEQQGGIPLDDDC